eukprot:CAMPEP_0198583226 /NCGR_PEP_ID=MMETSP1462-20131121/126492_1 /TAXON_ID=1333877 /ORGANISM="Brandtodinium nutriculum, Strain RCC3387" /LENGTH=244 /DNA_ID=CAMNT_0044314637 /DNA_START=140 /DNA_END=874 /DNA_ORIENTATION=+
MAFDGLRGSVGGLRLLTNQSQEPSAATLARLKDNGFHVEPHEFFGTLAACRRLVDSQALRPMFLLSDEAMADFDGVPTHEPNAVIVGTAAGQLHYERLGEALRVLLNAEGSQLIACNKGRYFRGRDGFALMAGPFVAALEYAAGCEAVVVGKPSQDFFHAAVRDVAEVDNAGLSKVLPHCVMIGDDWKDDMLGAMDAGMQAILLRTGKYRPRDEEKLPRPPLYVANDISDALGFLRREGLLRVE